MKTQARARLLSLVVLGVVFTSGILVGFAWARGRDTVEAEGVRTVEGPGVTADANPPDGERRRGVPLYEQVNPTELQRERIDSIVAAYRDDMRSFHRESRKAYEEGSRSLVLQTRDAIRGVLDAEQAQRYDSLAVAYDTRVREQSRPDSASRRN